MRRSRRPGGASAITKTLAGLAALVLLLTATGCIGLVPGFRIAPPRHEAESREKHRVDELGPFRNNATYRARAGVYVGDLVIRGNKVILIGAGAGQTIFTGDVAIHGNGCVLRDLSVQGDLTINGNNNDARGLQVRGRVRVSGNNNRW